MIHLACKYTFKELREGLLQEVKNGNIYQRINNGLELYNYTNQCTYSKSWNDFTLVARGIVLDPVNEKVVALPFPKFFNYGENGYFIPQLPFTISEKLDGSLGIIFNHNNKWHVVTRGSFNSIQSKWALSWLIMNTNVDKFYTGFTYLVEIIYKANQIVVKYPYEGLVLLGIYDNLIGSEVSPTDIPYFANMYGFRLPSYYNYEFNELVDVAKSLDANHEGFVVRFLDGTRIKLKGDEYCRIHALISNVTPLAIWRCMASGDSLEDIKKELPEEFIEDFTIIYNILMAKYQDYLSKLLQEYQSTLHLTDKELGLNLKTLSPVGQKFIFSIRKKHFFDEVKIGDSTVRKRFFEFFRPNNNILEGYTPSSIVSRFSEGG